MKDLEFVSSDSQIKEFVSKSNISKDNKKSTHHQTESKKSLNLVDKKLDIFRKLVKDKKVFVYALVAATIIAFAILSIFICNIPIIAIGVVTIIEAGLAKCLEGLPIWVHIIVFLLQILVGALTHVLLFVFFAATLYFLFLYGMNQIKRM